MASALAGVKGTAAVVGAVIAVNILVLEGVVSADALRLDSYGTWAGNFGHPWRLFTYFFVHLHWANFAANMALLAAGGWLLERRCGARAFLAVCLGGVLAGGLVFAAGTAMLGAASVNLTGASAGVVAVWMAYCFLGTLRRRVYIDLMLSPYTMAVTFVVASLVDVSRNNVWGAVAHFGGLVYGLCIGPLIFRKTLARLLGTASDPGSSRLYAEILDKVRRSGYGSLSPYERSLVFKNSQRYE